MTDNTSVSLRDRVQATLDLIRPNLQADGGDVELLNITDDGTVQVRLQGACHGCPMAAMTLQMGIERLLKKEVPEVKAVENIPEEE